MLTDTHTHTRTGRRRAATTHTHTHTRQFTNQVKKAKQREKKQYIYNQTHQGGVRHKISEMQIATDVLIIRSSVNVIINAGEEIREKEKNWLTRR